MPTLFWIFGLLRFLYHHLLNADPSLDTVLTRITDPTPTAAPTIKSFTKFFIFLSFLVNKCFFIFL